MACHGSAGGTHLLQSTEAGGAVSARHAGDQQDALTNCRARKQEGPSAQDMPGISRMHSQTAEYGSRGENSGNLISRELSPLTHKDGK